MIHGAIDVLWRNGTVERSVSEMAHLVQLSTNDDSCCALIIPIPSYYGTYYIIIPIITNADHGKGQWLLLEEVSALS